MTDLSFVLYDTALFSTTDEVDFRLFQVAEGGDSTHVKAFTNARGAGILPSTEVFVAEWLGVFPNEQLAEADMGIWFVDGYISVEIQNREVFRAPLALVLAGQKAGGHFTQAAAAARNLITISGEGYMLKLPLTIPGGVPWAVILHQGTVLATATQAIVCALSGVLTTP